MGRTWKIVAVRLFMALTLDLSGETEENHKQIIQDNLFSCQYLNLEASEINMLTL